MAEEKAADPLATLGLIDTTEAQKECWMIRVPAKLAQVWNEAPEGTVLGELVFKKGGKKNGMTIRPSLSVSCDESLVVNAQDTPVNYTMEAMTKRVPVLHPFTRTESGQVVVHGAVSRTANLQANKTDSRYRQLCKNRMVQSSVKSQRFVKPVESTELSVRKSLAKNKGFGSAVQAYGQRLKENDTPQESERKRKYEEVPTRSVIFELFSIQPYWTVKQLKEESGKPEKEIRAILQEIGDYHRSGEHKNMWALKNEYQKQG